MLHALPEDRPDCDEDTSGEPAAATYETDPIDFDNSEVLRRCPSSIDKEIAELMQRVEG